MNNSDIDELKNSMNLLPTFLLAKTHPEFKKTITKLTKGLSKKQLKQKIQFANFANEQITTDINKRVQIDDIDLSDNDLSEHSYQLLLIIFGVPKLASFYQHAKFFDEILVEDFSKNLVIKYKDKLIQDFNYDIDFLDEDIGIEAFYMHLLLDFFAHLDAYIHFSIYSKKIKPISLGWLFMQKLDDKKIQYNSETEKYISTNKNGLFHTIPSRSFLQFLQCVQYLNQNLKMPKSFYGLTNKINWQHIDDPDGKLDAFIRRKSEGKWISLVDVYWLLGIKEQSLEEQECYDRVSSFQSSFVSYIKDEKVDEFNTSYPQNFEGLIWFVYAFFQNVYEQNIESYKKNTFIIHSQYYDLWEFYNRFYENKLTEEDKNKRIEWMEDIKNQATRNHRMA